MAGFIAPPSVMEQNGTLTGFSVDLWNAIAARLKVKTSYQIMPDVSHLEEAMRSKNADLTLGLFITSARDEVFDFSIPTLQAGLQVMVRDTGEKAETASPVWDMLRLLFRCGQPHRRAGWVGHRLCCHCRLSIDGLDLCHRSCHSLRISGLGAPAARG